MHVVNRTFVICGVRWKTTKHIISGRRMANADLCGYSYLQHELNTRLPMKCIYYLLYSRARIFETTECMRWLQERYRSMNIGTERGRYYRYRTCNPTNYKTIRVYRGRAFFRCRWLLRRSLLRRLFLLDEDCRRDVSQNLDVLLRLRGHCRWGHICIISRCLRRAKRRCKIEQRRVEGGCV